MTVLRIAVMLAAAVARMAAAASRDADPARLRRRMRVVDDWATNDGDRAHRLTAHETISVTRVGRFADIDPLRTGEGWRDRSRLAVVGAWVTTVGAAAAWGRWRGAGPLAGLRREDS